MLKHALRGKPGYHNFRVLSFCSSSYFCQHATHFLLKKKLFDLLKSTLIIHARTPTYTLHVRDKNPISYSYVNSLATHPACALHCISYAKKALLTLQPLPWPNDSSPSAACCWSQHVAHVWQPCCDVLQHVWRRWPKFGNGQIFHATFMDVA